MRFLLVAGKFNVIIMCIITIITYYNYVYDIRYKRRQQNGEPRDFPWLRKTYASHRAMDYIIEILVLTIMLKNKHLLTFSTANFNTS